MRDILLMRDKLPFMVLRTPWFLNPSGTAHHYRIVALLEKQLKNMDNMPATLSYYIIHKHI